MAFNMKALEEIKKGPEEGQSFRSEGEVREIEGYMHFLDWLGRYKSDYINCGIEHSTQKISDYLRELVQKHERKYFPERSLAGFLQNLFRAGYQI